MRNNHFFMFARAQASAFTGGITDYIVMIICTELFHIHYTISIAVGGIIGAIVNFSINRRWTFKLNGSDKGNVSTQFVKFVSMVLGSIFLKSSGTFLITNFLKIDYKISRVITDLIVSFGFNYTLQKYWVFRKERKQIM